MLWEGGFWGRNGLGEGGVRRVEKETKDAQKWLVSGSGAGEAWSMTLRGLSFRGFAKGWLGPQGARRDPVLLFFGLYVSLVFLLLGNSLVVLSLLCLLFQGFEGFAGWGNPFWGFPWYFRKDQGKGGHGDIFMSRDKNCRETPKNLFGLFLTFRVISILQGYFWGPSENTL